MYTAVYNIEKRRIIFMKHGDIIILPLLVRQILLKYSDEQNAVGMAKIRQHLSDMGIEADRRSVYRAISVLNEHGEKISYSGKKEKKGYWIRHPFTVAEAFFLSDAIRSSSILSNETGEQFTARITGMLSDKQAASLPKTLPSPSKSDNDRILKTIELLLNAISGLNPVEFRYYDLSVTRKKQYRRNSRKYHLIPYALVSNAGRYYCVFYSEEHGSFANYRIDKMDMVHVLEEKADPVYFSLQDHIRASFNMYHGEPETVIVDFDLSLANVIFDEFGKDIIISHVGEKRFTASIRTAVTPTLISWLLQFYDRMEVRKPDTLRKQLLNIAQHLHHTYSEQEA